MREQVSKDSKEPDEVQLTVEDIGQLNIHAQMEDHCQTQQHKLFHHFGVPKQAPVGCPEQELVNMQWPNLPEFSQKIRPRQQISSE